MYSPQMCLLKCIPQRTQWPPTVPGSMYVCPRLSVEVLLSVHRKPALFHMWPSGGSILHSQFYHFLFLSFSFFLSLSLSLSLSNTHTHTHLLMPKQESESESPVFFSFFDRSMFFVLCCSDLARCLFVDAYETAPDIHSLLLMAISASTLFAILIDRAYLFIIGKLNYW